MFEKTAFITIRLIKKVEERGRKQFEINKPKRYVYN